MKEKKHTHALEARHRSPFTRKTLLRLNVLGSIIYQYEMKAPKCPCIKNHGTVVRDANIACAFCVLAR